MSGLRAAGKQVRSTSEPTLVLLVGDAYYGVLATVRALRAAGYAPWLAVSQAGTYAERSRATVGTVRVPDPVIDEEGFVRELAAAAARLSVEAVLPGAEVHLHALVGCEADFPGIAWGTPSRKSVERATAKELLVEFAATAGLRTPPTKKVVSSDSEEVGAFGFPTIVKPLQSCTRNPDGTMSSYSSRYVCDKREAEEALVALPDGKGLVQQYIPGQLVSVAGVCWEGELVCTMHQVSPRIWPVPLGVSSYAETIPPDAQLERGVGCLLQTVGWSGLFQVQFIRTPGGEHYLIDLNPRIYGSLALAVAAGLNLPAIWVDLLLGRLLDIGNYRVGMRFRQEEKDVRALLWMLAHGEPRRALKGFVPRRATTHAIFSLRDQMPLLTSAVKLVRWSRG